MRKIQRIRQILKIWHSQRVTNMTDYEVNHWWLSLANDKKEFYVEHYVIEYKHECLSHDPFLGGSSIFKKNTTIKLNTLKRIYCQ